MSYYDKKVKIYNMLKTTILKAGKPVPFSVLELAVFEQSGFSERLIRNILDKLVKADKIIKYDTSNDTYFSEV